MQLAPRTEAVPTAVAGHPVHRRWDVLIGLLVVAVAFALRVALAPDYDLGMDGGVSVTLAVSPVRELLEFSGKDVHPPAFYLLLKAWLRLAGETPFSVKYPTVLAGVVTVAAVWYIARRCAGTLAATVAAGLLALGATPIGASLTVRDLAPGLAVGLVALTQFLRVLRLEAGAPYVRYRLPTSLEWTAIGVLNALAVLTSYAAVPVVITQAIVFAISRPRRIGPALTGAAVSILLVAPWLAYTGMRLAAKATGQESQRPPGAPVVPLPEFLVRELALVVTGEFGATHIVTAVGVALLIAFGLAVAWRHPERRVGVLAVGVAGLLTGALVFATINLWLAEGFAARYGYIAIPFVAVLVGCGVASVWSFLRRSDTNGPFSYVAPALSGGLCLLLAGGAIYGLRAWMERPALPESFWEPRALIAYLDRVAGPGDAVVFTTPEQSGYYEVLSTRGLPWRHFTIGADYLTDDVPARTEALLPPLGAVSDRVWVVLYQSGLPGTEPIREWLARHWWLAGAEWVPDSQVLEYRTNGSPLTPITPITFTGDGGVVNLEGLGIPPSVAAGAYLPVSLEWRVVQPTAHAQTVFVHLIGPDGKRYAQRDAQPGGGLWPFNVMDPNSLVPDRHALTIPADAPPGEYALQIGLYAGDQRMASSVGGTAYQVSGIRVTRP